MNRKKKKRSRQYLLHLNVQQLLSLQNQEDIRQEEIVEAKCFAQRERDRRSTQPDES